jgi:transcriptional regulator with XRE-family HTH domain
MTLRELRISKGYAQREIAEKLGVKTVNTISNWERGLTEPELPMRRQMSEFFGVSLDEMNRIIKETRQQAKTQ